VKVKRSLCVWRQIGLPNILNVVDGRRSDCNVDMAALVIRDCQHFINLSSPNCTQIHLYYHGAEYLGCSMNRMEVKKFHFLEPKVYFSPEPDESIPCPFYVLKANLNILASTPRSFRWSVFSGLPTRLHYAFLLFPMRSTCPALT